MDKKPRNIIFGERVQRAIDEGVSKTYRAVATTLGSKGRNVGIEKNWGAPLIIHDGVTVAREVVLKDPFANMAAQQVIYAAQKTNDQAGDGTTTAVVLTHAIVQEGLKQIAAKVNPQILRKGIERATAVVVAELQKMATKVSSFDEMKQVASISAASDSLGELIARAIEKVGEHGVVSVQEGTSTTIEVEYKEGMDFPQGRISPYMVTDLERDEAVLKGSGESRPFIALVDQELNNDDLFNKILNPLSTFNKSATIVIIANDFDADAKSTLVVNRIRASKLYIGVKSPEYGEHRTNMLHDIAKLTGATVIGGSSGIPFSSVALEHFGRAEKAIVNKEQTMIIGGAGDKKEIAKHITGIRKLMKTTKTEFIKDKLEARLAKLVGGVAVISVGANSEAEMRELKERVYDAVNATQAALELGIVPGGGVALLRASVVLDKLKESPESIGIKIVRDALMYPLIKLVDNAGGNSGHVLETIKKDADKNMGYNVNSEAFENMLTSGIIDPVKVTISALKNASSTATMLLTMDCMISLERDNPTEQSMSMEGIGSFAN